MNRHLVYPGQIPLETDLLNVARDAYMGLAKLAEGLLGSNPVIAGFAVTPTSPASMTVSIAPGQIYSRQVLDASDFSSLGEDTSSVVKQGLMLTALTPAVGSFAAPATAGQAVNYLVQIGYLSADTGATVLPYFNSSNPTMAWTGPDNSGSSQATVRADLAVVSVLAGAAATSGTQTTPTPNSGCVGAYVITVANGQGTITSDNIAVYSTASFLGNQPAGFSLNSMAPLASPALTGNPTAPTQTPGDNSGKLASTAYADAAAQKTGGAFAVDSGTANALTVTLSPAPVSLAALLGQPLRIKKGGADNTGAVTLNVNGLGAVEVPHADYSALTAGELPAGGVFTVVYDGSKFALQSVGYQPATPAAVVAEAESAAQAAGGGYGVDSGAVNALVIALSPAPASQAALTGLPLRIKVANAVTGTCSLNVCGLGAVAIVHGDGSNIVSGEIPAGAIITVVYSGTQYQLQSVAYRPALLDAIQAVYPVGSVYLSATSANPATTLGFGSWSQIAQGRALLGVGTGTDINGDTLAVAEGSSGDTVGEYRHTLTTTEMPAHSHVQNGNTLYAGSYYIAAGPGGNAGEATYSTNSTGDDGPHNNIQPYFGVYVWARTA